VRKYRQRTHPREIGGYARGSPDGFLRPLAVKRADRLPLRSIFYRPSWSSEGYEWFVALVVLVGLYFAVRNFIRARR
jgi:hypothetical protein